MTCVHREKMRLFQSLMDSDFDSWMDLLEFVPSEDLGYLFWLACRLCGVSNSLSYGLEAGMPEHLYTHIVNTQVMLINVDQILYSNN